jgi:hypothetical protein
MYKRILRTGRKVLGKLKWWMQRRAAALSSKPIVHMLHIGKTGGTAIQHALRPHARAGRFAILFHKHDATLQDVPRGEAVVFFLRDPVSRFVSGFNSRLRQGQPRYLVPWDEREAAAFNEFTDPNALARALSSDDPGQRERAMRAMRAIQHVRNSYWEWFADPDYFRARLSDVFFIGFQESLDADFQMLKRKLGLSGPIELPADDIQAHRNPRAASSHLDETATVNLRSWYAADYSFLDMCRELAPDINKRQDSRGG